MYFIHLEMFYRSMATGARGIGRTLAIGFSAPQSTIDLTTVSHLKAGCKASGVWSWLGQWVVFETIFFETQFTTMQMTTGI